MNTGKKRGRPSGKRKRLSEDAIISTAKTLLKNQGKIPSIRALAGALHVDAMAIYYYFENKQALLEAITRSLMMEVTVSHTAQEWPLKIISLSEDYLMLLNQYPGLLEIMLSMQTQGPVELFAQQFEDAVAGQGLTEAQIKDGMDLLVDYLHGFALAMACNKHNNPISLDMIHGPLTLYCRALSADKQ